MNVKIYVIVLSVVCLSSMGFSQTVKFVKAEFENMRTEPNGHKMGVILQKTPIDVIDDYVKELNVVQLMSIGSIGSYGAVFEEGVYEKISSIRKKYPDVTIEIDGGVNLENAKKLVEAGANNLVIGSAIFKSENVEEAIEQFKGI